MKTLSNKAKIGFVIIALASAEGARACAITSIKAAEWTCGGRFNALSQHSHDGKVSNTITATTAAFAALQRGEKRSLPAEGSAINAEASAMIATAIEPTATADGDGNRDNFGRGCDSAFFNCFSEYGAHLASGGTLRPGAVQSGKAPPAADVDRARDFADIVDFRETSTAGKSTASDTTNLLNVQAVTPIIASMALDPAVVANMNVSSRNIAVPEPASMGLLGIGFVFLLIARRRVNAID